MDEPLISRQELQAKIAEFCLMDDTYMTAFFNGQPELIELVLGIILERDDLKITGSRTQHRLKNLRGHSSVLDIYAVDRNNARYNIEIQCRPEGALPRRARYYSSLLDCDSLPEGEDYRELPEVYVIFITEKDIFGGGKAVYTVTRKISEMNDIPFGDDSNIIYVNAEKVDETPLGRLIHDFKCAVPDQMYYPELSHRASEIKEMNGGEKGMCRIMEELNEKASAIAVERVSKKNALRMLGWNKLTLEEISEGTGLPLEEVRKLAAEAEAKPE